MSSSRPRAEGTERILAYVQVCLCAGIVWATIAGVIALLISCLAKLQGGFMLEKDQEAFAIEPLDIKLVTHRSSLNFVNTVDSHERETPREYLASYDHLLAWALLVGLLGPEELESLQNQARLEAQEADRILQEAYSLRYDLYRIYVACIDHQALPESALRHLNKVLACAPPRSQLRQHGHGLVWDLSESQISLALPLWQIAWDAAALLTSSELDRLRKCSGAGCTWMFIDTSRAQNRRWCMMGWCGNRAKARRHYQRQRSSEFD
jgi:predicted RNA-binding Zn ribbon-like protein